MSTARLFFVVYGKYPSFVKVFQRFLLMAIHGLDKIVSNLNVGFGDIYLKTMESFLFY
jgi:hypothetical protein